MKKNNNSVQVTDEAYEALEVIMRRTGIEKKGNLVGRLLVWAAKLEDWQLAHVLSFFPQLVRHQLADQLLLDMLTDGTASPEERAKELLNRLRLVMNMARGSASTLEDTARPRIANQNQTQPKKA